MYRLWLYCFCNLRGESKGEKYGCFQHMYLSMINCTGIVMFLGDGEVNKLPNGHKRKATIKKASVILLGDNTNTTKYII